MIAWSTGASAASKCTSQEQEQQQQKPTPEQQRNRLFAPPNDFWQLGMSTARPRSSGSAEWHSEPQQPPEILIQDDLVRFKNYDLMSAIQTLAEKNGLNVAFDQSIMSRRINFELRSVTPQAGT
jgi:hypothetical protein